MTTVATRSTGAKVVSIATKLVAKNEAAKKSVSKNKAAAKKSVGAKKKVSGAKRKRG
jgi:hypothetical protein